MYAHGRSKGDDHPACRREKYSTLYFYVYGTLIYDAYLNLSSETKWTMNVLDLRQTRSVLNWITLQVCRSWYVTSTHANLAGWEIRVC